MRHEPCFIRSRGCLGADAGPTVSLEVTIGGSASDTNNEYAAENHQQSNANHESKNDRPWGRFHLRHHPVSLQLFKSAEHAGVGGTIKNFESEDGEAEVEDRSREQWPPPWDTK